jgi:putative Mg2+ transporter-C (MgtC) family protein
MNWLADITNWFAGSGIVTWLASWDLAAIDSDMIDIVSHLLASMLAGAAIGIERSYHGRPAGFRTHVLVCMSSALLMLVTMYQSHWFPGAADIVRVDPTRMAQGIMTGIGFLGAGVIMKEGLSVRGLTTAASIWITAAIGILAGIGFYFPLVVGTILTICALSLFRWIESKLPVFYYAYHYVSFSREQAPAEDDLRAVLAAHGFDVSNMSWRLDNHGRVFEYRMTIRSRNRRNASRLAQTWSDDETVLEFRITPT